MKWLTILLLLALALPLRAQNNGLPNRVQSVVLLELFVDRGPACGLLEPWQAEALRVQTREEAGRLDDAEREFVAREVEVRRSEMTCEDGLLVQWTEAVRPNLEREFLPELFTGYIALASLPEPPAAFVEATQDYQSEAVIARLELRLAELEAEGVAPPSRQSWSELRARQADRVAELAAAASGAETNGRYTQAEAEQTIRDVASIVALWLAEE